MEHQHTKQNNDQNGINDINNNQPSDTVSSIVWVNESIFFISTWAGEILGYQIVSPRRPQQQFKQGTPTTSSSSSSSSLSQYSSSSSSSIYHVQQQQSPSQQIKFLNQLQQQTIETQATKQLSQQLNKADIMLIFQFKDKRNNSFSRPILAFDVQLQQQSQNYDVYSSYSTITSSKTMNQQLQFLIAASFSDGEVCVIGYPSLTITTVFMSSIPISFVKFSLHLGLMTVDLESRIRINGTTIINDEITAFSSSSNSNNTTTQKHSSATSSNPNEDSFSHCSMSESHLLGCAFEYPYLLLFDMSEFVYLIDLSKNKFSKIVRPFAQSYVKSGAISICNESTDQSRYDTCRNNNNNNNSCNNNENSITTKQQLKNNNLYNVEQFYNVPSSNASQDKSKGEIVLGSFDGQVSRASFRVVGAANVIWDYDYSNNKLGHFTRKNINCIPQQSSGVSTEVGNGTSQNNSINSTGQTTTTYLFSVNAVASVPNHVGPKNHMLSAGGEGKIILWKKPTNKILVNHPLVNISCLSLSPTKEYLAYATGYDWHKGFTETHSPPPPLIHVIQYNSL